MPGVEWWEWAALILSGALAIAAAIAWILSGREHRAARRANRERGYSQ